MNQFMSEAMSASADEKLGSLFIAVILFGYITNVIYSAYLRRKTMLVSEDGMYMNINEYRKYISYKDTEEHEGFITRNILRGIGVMMASSVGLLPVVLCEDTPGIGSFVFASTVTIFLSSILTKSHYGENMGSEQMSNLFVKTPEAFRHGGKYVAEPLKFKTSLSNVEFMKKEMKRLNDLIEQKEIKLEKATTEENHKKIKKHTTSLKKLRKELEQAEDELKAFLDETLTFVSDRPTPEVYKILKRNAGLSEETPESLKSPEPLESAKEQEQVAPKERYHIEVLKGIEQNGTLPDDIRQEATEILEAHRLKEIQETNEDKFKDVQLDLKVARDIVEKDATLDRGASENVV